MNRHFITADTLLRDCIFCAIDLETTGVNPLTHEIVEAAALRFTLPGGVDGAFHSIVKPAGGITAESTAVHGITDAMTAGAPEIIDVTKKLFAFLDTSIIVAHNAGFDVSFLVMATGKRPLPMIGSVDSERIARRAFPGLQSYRLGVICSLLGIHISPHRALPDAYGCMEIFRNSLAVLDPAEAWTVGELAKRFGPLHKAWRKAMKAKNAMTSSPVSNLSGGVLFIRYRGADGVVTEREIEPFEIIRYGRRSYLKAYCRFRKDLRLFRTDRITLLDPDGDITTFCVD